jgi:hypothetical protein
MLTLASETVVPAMGGVLDSKNWGLAVLLAERPR